MDTADKHTHTQESEHTVNLNTHTHTLDGTSQSGDGICWTLASEGEFKILKNKLII